MVWCTIWNNKMKTYGFFLWMNRNEIVQTNFWTCSQCLCNYYLKTLLIWTNHHKFLKNKRKTILFVHLNACKFVMTLLISQTLVARIVLSSLCLGVFFFFFNCCWKYCSILLHFSPFSSSLTSVGTIVMTYFLLSWYHY